MNPRRRLYILAFAAYTTTLALMTALAWLAFQHSTAAGIAQLTVSLSGNALGGFALVLGILRDDRAERERQRADEAVESARKSEQKANEARQLADQLQKQVEQSKKEAEQLHAQAEQERRQTELERQRADRAEAELRRVRDEQQLEARFRRLEEALGLIPETGTSDDQVEES